MVDYSQKASCYREYAEEVRARAEAMHDVQSKQILLRLAGHYDQLASDYDAIAAMKVSD